MLPFRWTTVRKYLNVKNIAEFVDKINIKIN